MFGKDHVLFTVVIVAVHFARALSFSFGPKNELHPESTESGGVLAKAGRWFNELKQKSEKDYDFDNTPKLGGVLPTQLRSSEVKRSKKQWLSMDRTSAVAPKNAQTVSHNVLDIASGQRDVYDNMLEQSYIPDPDSTQNTLSVAGKSDLQNLNALLRRNAALDNQLDSNVDASRATMSFKIEMTPRAAEITVSIGPGTSAGSLAGSPADTTANLVEKDSRTDSEVILKEEVSFEEDGTTQVTADELQQHNDNESTDGDTSTMVDYFTTEINRDIPRFMEENTQRPVPYLLYDNNNSSSIVSNIYTAPNATLSSPIHTTTTTPTTTAMDLSYRALFCFILGVLCTYLLNKLVTSVVTWYKGRIPRYIAGLEKQSIRLLSEHRYAEVKTLLTTHLPCIEGYKGTRHTDVAAFRHFLGKALLALGEHRPACSELNTVVSIYESYGEDLYMAHALEDLALAQQELATTTGKSNNTTAALTTMQRALRIFTEEALAQQALATHPLSTTTIAVEDLEAAINQGKQLLLFLHQSL